MPAHDNVAHFQHIHCELHDGQAIEVGMHHDIGDVAMHEQSPGGSPTISLAGTRLSEQPIHR